MILTTHNENLVQTTLLQIAMFELQTVKDVKVFKLNCMNNILRTKEAKHIHPMTKKCK